MSNLVTCPVCKSAYCRAISTNNTYIEDKGYGAGKGCCGYILFGPLGLLCGLCGGKRRTRTTTQTYWHCDGCGNKFTL